jgi:hypothetical protein
MRANLPPKLEFGRERTGPFASDPDCGFNGMFHVMGPTSEELRIVASDGHSFDAQGWEHVSVSCRRRPPNWTEMCFVKNLFWGPDECVVQFHPPEKDYINCHPYCLHLWRSKTQEFPKPPTHFVGPRNAIISVRP